MINTSEFHKIADELLQGISENMESKYPDSDIEYLQGVLNIELSDGRKYVLNKHEPTKQIWLSSPFSGAHKFKYDKSSAGWLDHNKIELIKLIDDEIVSKS